jgi:hypothetical protein
MSRTFLRRTLFAGALLPALAAVDMLPTAGQPPKDAKTQSVQNLGRIGLALHMYHHDYEQFPPPVIYGKDEKPLLSWRVLILPYLGEADLYRQFRLHEPWDSEHNRKLLAKMPKVYAPVAGQVKEPHATYCQVFNGPGALFESDPARWRRFPSLHPASFECGPKVRLRQLDIPDGSSNTIMLVEAGPPVSWTKPDDLPFDPNKPLPKLNGPHADGFYAVLGDRSVRFIKKTVSEEILRCLIDRRDGKVVTIDL